MNQYLPDTLVKRSVPAGNTIHGTRRPGALVRLTSEETAIWKTSTCRRNGGGLRLRAQFIYSRDAYIRRCSAPRFRPPYLERPPYWN